MHSFKFGTWSIVFIDNSLEARQSVETSWSPRASIDELQFRESRSILGGGQGDFIDESGPGSLQRQAGGQRASINQMEARKPRSLYRLVGGQRVSIGELVVKVSL